jgi:hypothetical protein
VRSHQCDSIIPHPNSKLPPPVPDFDLEPSRPRVVECIAQCVSPDPVNVIPQYRMQVLWSAIHLYGKTKYVSLRKRSICSDFLTQRLNGLRKFVFDQRGSAQILDRISRLGDRLSGVVECGLQNLLGIRGARREEVVDRLATEEQAMETLQQRVVQFARDSRASSIRSSGSD